MNIIVCITRIFALILVAVLTLTSSITASPGQQLFGQLIVESNYGTVTMNGETVIDERTFLSAADIVTSTKSSARISFGKMGQIGIASNSKLHLDFSETQITGVFTSGQITVAAAPNTEIRIQTADGIVTNFGLTNNSVIVIDVVKGKTRVKSVLGSAALNGVIIREGEISFLQTTGTANQAEKASIFFDVLISLARAMYVAELLEANPQTTTLKTNITDSVSQVNVGPMISD